MSPVPHQSLVLRDPQPLPVYYTRPLRSWPATSQSQAKVTTWKPIEMFHYSNIACLSKCKYPLPVAVVRVFLHVEFVEASLFLVVRLLVGVGHLLPLGTYHICTNHSKPLLLNKLNSPPACFLLVLELCVHVTITTCRMSRHKYTHPVSC